MFVSMISTRVSLCLLVCNSIGAIVILCMHKLVINICMHILTPSYVSFSHMDMHISRDVLFPFLFSSYFFACLVFVLVSSFCSFVCLFSMVLFVLFVLLVMSVTSD